MRIIIAGVAPRCGDRVPKEREPREQYIRIYASCIYIFTKHLSQTRSD